MQFSKAIARACAEAVLAAIVPVGCGHSTAGPDSAAQLKIGQIGQLFHIYQKRQSSPPQGIKDVESLRVNLPAAVGSIRSGEVLVYWGAGISRGPEASSPVLAYHKDVPEKGGEVLMQDGTAKKMSAEEFKAAPKPAGATTEAHTSADKTQKKR
jgi:hypothetical protein